MNYDEFIKQKSQFKHEAGFAPTNLPDFLFDFQAYLVDWALRKGRAAIFADCGMGKTAMQLAFAQQVIERENKPVLILAPLAVVPQTIEEGERFGINVTRDGGDSLIHITNYQRLERFNPHDYCGVVCDESSILKSYSGSTRTAIIEFMKPSKYRLLCSATPSPNDFIELGNSVEALGIMRRVEMLATYFVHDGGDTSRWRLRGHAEDPFWAFVASWARALRTPSDVGFDSSRFVLPKLEMESHVLDSVPMDGFLFSMKAMTLEAQRAERRATIDERCQVVADIANESSEPFIAWCSLNDESKRLSKAIDGSVEVSGSMKDEEKEEAFTAFRKGHIKALVTKPSLAAFGMNWQHCNRMSFFPSHSHEQFYQAVRRCWRFGQSRDVTAHIVTTEAEEEIVSNLRRKETQSIELFKKIVSNMASYYQSASDIYNPTKETKAPQWLTV
jgi:hypothetical protein